MVIHFIKPVWHQYFEGKSWWYLNLQGGGGGDTQGHSGNSAFYRLVFIKKKQPLFASKHRFRIVFKAISAIYTKTMKTIVNGKRKQQTAEIYCLNVKIIWKIFGSCCIFPAGKFPMLFCLFHAIFIIITHWEKLLDSDWLRDCGFIRNLRANSVIRGKLQISRAKSVIHSQ